MSLPWSAFALLHREPPRMHTWHECAPPTSGDGLFVRMHDAGCPAPYVVVRQSCAVPLFADRAREIQRRHPISAMWPHLHLPP